MAKFDFEKLEVYQRAVKFASKICEVTRDFPTSLQFGLADQLRRASLSISLNVSEGSGAFYKKEKIKFYRIGRRSIFECIPAIQVSIMQNLMNKKLYENLYNECYELSCMLSGLINSLKKK